MALDALQASEYEIFLAHYVSYSESDRFNDRSQLMQDGVHYTRGLFQQSDQWWPNPLDITIATQSFVMAMRGRPQSNDPTIEAWNVQHWLAPNPANDLAGFFAAPETANYTRRLVKVPDLIADPWYFEHHPDGKGII